MKFTNFFKKSKIERKSKEKQSILLHFHIFKNAGSTIEWLLEKNFPKKNLSIDGENPGEIIQMKQINDILERKTSIKTISSHQIRYPIPKNTRFNFISILFLRHPIDRAFSIYYFKKNEIDDSIGSIKARSMSLPEFIKWNMDFKEYMPMKNFQVLFLSNKTTKEGVSEKDLEIAINRMKSSSIIGVVDRMDESLVIAESFLKQEFPKINLAYVKQNVSKERKGTMIERLKHSEDNLGTDLKNRLIEYNKLDMKLYHSTNKEMDKRKKKIQDFERKIQDFERRCKDLNVEKI